MFAVVDLTPRSCVMLEAAVHEHGPHTGSQSGVPYVTGEFQGFEHEERSIEVKLLPHCWQTVW